MKKNTFVLIATLTMVTLATGCTSMTRRTTSISNSSQYTINVSDITINPKIEVKTKVTGKATQRFLFCFIPLDDWVELVGAPIKWNFPLFTSPFKRSTIDEATRDAFHISKADVLIAPYYDVTSKNYILWSTYTATVTGYAGKYTSFRQQSQPLQQDAIVEEKVNK